MTTVARPVPSESVWARFTRWVFSHPRLALLLLLLAPIGWLLIFYIGSLIMLVVQSFFYIDDFSAVVIRELSLRTYGELFSVSNMEVVGRTVLMAAVVTVVCAIIGFPLAYFMARFARGRMKNFLYLAILLPLWSSYLVRVYCWKLILANEGIINWFFELLGLGWLRQAILDLPVIGGPSLSFSFLGMFLVFVYIWLPYMILPIFTALERVPKSLIEASGDLGARPGQTFRNVILPLAFPGVIAGSIFTFSLTLGDYIIPDVIGNSSPFIGPTVNVLQGTNGNFPLAAAFTLVPIVIMSVYLLVARRLGAFDAL